MHTYISAFHDSRDCGVTNSVFFFQYFPDRFVRKEILNLKVKCLGHDNGCGWTGKLKDYEVMANSLASCVHGNNNVFSLVTCRITSKSVCLSRRSVNSVAMHSPYWS